MSFGLLVPRLCLGTHYPRESTIDYAWDGTARQSLAVARSQAEPGTEAPNASEFDKNGEFGV